MKKLLFLFFVFAFFSIAGYGQTVMQTTGLPKMKEGQSYTLIRKKLLRAGWKPYKSPDADKCSPGDKRCKGRPEMESCAGTGQANCSFLWKRGEKVVSIFTVGENTIYSGFRLN